jgi:hypothetical protein
MWFAESHNGRKPSLKSFGFKYLPATLAFSNICAPKSNNSFVLSYLSVCAFFYLRMPSPHSIYRSHSKSVNDKTRSFLWDSLRKNLFALALNHHQRTIIAALLPIGRSVRQNPHQQRLQ